MSDPVSTRMGDHLWTGKPFRYERMRFQTTLEGAESLRCSDAGWQRVPGTRRSDEECTVTSRRTTCVFLWFILLLRSLEAELTSLSEHIAVYAENLSVKDKIVQSLSLQLADLQGCDGHLTYDSSSNSARTLVETTRQLERLTVLDVYVLSYK